MRHSALLAVALLFAQPAIAQKIGADETIVNGPLTVQNNGLPTFVVDGSGNLIGSPSFRIGSVAIPWGNIYTRTLVFRSTGDVSTVFDFDGTSGAGKIQVYSGGTATTVGTQFYTLVLNPSGGNVGVGTSGPGAKLDVNGTLRGQMLSLGAAPTTGNIPASYWTVVKRTDDASVKICANDAGTIKCVALQ